MRADDEVSAVHDSAAGSTRRTATLVAGGILASRLTGLARERGISHFLGTSFAADAFTVAFRLPNLLQHLLGEGVLSASFIPVYGRLLGDGREEEEAGRVAGAVLGLLAVVTGVVVVVGVVAAEPLTTVVAAGLRDRPDAFALTVRLVRILFPAVGLLVLSAWCLGVLNSHRRFFLSYVAPALLNLAQLATLVAVGPAVVVPDPTTGLRGAMGEARLVTWLAVGTVVGGLLQFGVQVPTVVRVTRGLRPSLRIDLPGVRRTIRSFLPVVGARGVVQVSTFVHVFLASFLAAGALATLRFSQILHGLPIALFGMSVAAAELPELSRTGPAERAEVADRLAPGLARIAALVVPTAVGYLVLGDLLVGAVFQSGAFGSRDTVAVWLAVRVCPGTGGDDVVTPAPVGALRRRGSPHTFPRGRRSRRRVRSPGRAVDVLVRPDRRDGGRDRGRRRPAGLPTAPGGRPGRPAGRHPPGRGRPVVGGGRGRVAGVRPVAAGRHAQPRRRPTRWW